jgi:NADH-quinone oxidoreductase subunit L
MNGLFAMAPDTMMVIAIVGAATAIFAASIGFAQNDIKRVLAYSTVSQLGYMFLAMGVGAFTAGIFHLMTHAFFKACLFLGSGSVIHAMHHGLHHAHLHDDPQDMRNMGGLAKKMPITYWTFLISTLAIAGFPLLSGFFSKDEILWWSFGSTRGSIGLWVIGACAAGMTAFYMFRAVSMTFWGQSRTNAKARDHIHESPLVITLPLMVLAFLALVGGWIGVPKLIGDAFGGIGNRFEHFLEPVFGHSQETYHIAIRESLHHSHGMEWGLMGLSVLIAFIGIGIGLFMYLKRPELPGKFTAAFPRFYKAVFNKWYIDELYDALFVNPCKRFGTFCWKGFDVKVIDGMVNGLARLFGAIAAGLRGTQTGMVHNYAMGMVVGVVLIVGFFVLK